MDLAIKHRWTLIVLICGSSSFLQITSSAWTSLSDSLGFSTDIAKNQNWRNIIYDMSIAVVRSVCKSISHPFKWQAVLCACGLPLLFEILELRDLKRKQDLLKSAGIDQNTINLAVSTLQNVKNTIAKLESTYNGNVSEWEKYQATVALILTGEHCALFAGLAFVMLVPVALFCSWMSEAFCDALLLELGRLAINC